MIRGSPDPFPIFEGGVRLRQTTGRHQTVFHLLLTFHYHSLLSFVPYYAVIELVDLLKVLIACT